MSAHTFPPLQLTGVRAVLQGQGAEGKSILSSSGEMGRRVLHCAPTLRGLRNHTGRSTGTFHVANDVVMLKTFGFVFL